MNYSAIQHHAYDVFCYPLNENELQLNIKTSKDISRVFIIYGDPFEYAKSEDKYKWVHEKQEITECCSTQSNLVWSCVLSPAYKRLQYFFEIHSGNEKKLYFEDGFYEMDELADINPRQHVAFIFPWMNEADICKTPEWAKKTIWYQIFPSRFAHGENPACTKKNLPWAQPEKKVKNEENYGGNIRGLIEKLDYLEALGINGIYLNPINKARTQHKYDTENYFEIDSDFGTNLDMKEFVEKAHQKKIRVMVDGVFNHCGWFHEAWQDVLQNRQNSKYASWFMVNDFNFDEQPGKMAYEKKYYSFAMVDYMPKLNTNNPEVRKYICDICEFWVKEFDIDAIRLDVANEISHALCKELRFRMHSLKEDFFIVGEIWNDSLPWLRGDEFDSVINYRLRTAITDFALNKKLTAEDFEQRINDVKFLYFKQTQQVLINQLDSHDTIRITTLTENNELTKLQLAFLFIMTGSVCIYYGTEVLLEGENDPDCRRCMPWDGIKKGRYNQELNFMKKLIQIRKDFSAMSSPDMKFIYDSQGTLNSRILQILKIDEESGQKIFAVFNFSDENFIVRDEQLKDAVFYNRLEGNKILPYGFIFCKI